MPAAAAAAQARRSLWEGLATLHLPPPAAPSRSLVDLRVARQVPEHQEVFFEGETAGENGGESASPIPGLLVTVEVVEDAFSRRPDGCDMLRFFLTDLAADSGATVQNVTDDSTPVSLGPGAIPTRAGPVRVCAGGALFLEAQGTHLCVAQTLLRFIERHTMMGVTVQRRLAAGEDWQGVLADLMQKCRKTAASLELSEAAVEALLA